MKNKILNPRNPWMMLANALTLPLILATVPFIAAYVIFETLSNKQDEN